MLGESLLWQNTVSILLEALPFLGFGFCIAGILKAFVPDTLIAKYLGQENLWSPIKATMLGTPIPLCSCSVIPVATSLRRGGAGKGSITGFLISAPETGVDSLSLSYAMLGPVMLIARLISAIFTSIATAWAVVLGTKNIPMRPMPEEQKTCCSASGAEVEKSQSQGVIAQFINGQRYAFTTLLDDSFKWVMVALVATIVIKTYVPTEFFTGYGDGIISMLVMVAISFPLYICASASTPVAVSLLLVGMSPGAVLVFMLAGPASNIATIGVVHKLLNRRSAIIYVVGVCVCSVLSGLALNWFVDLYDLDILAQVQQQTILHAWVSIPTTIFVLLSAIKPLRPYIGLSLRNKV